MRDYVEIACDLMDLDEGDVLSSKVYEDHLAFVVRQGQKYIIPLDELQPEDVEPEREIVATTEAMAYAKAHGVDLMTVEGTGSNGRILVRDVRKAVQDG